MFGLKKKKSFHQDFHTGRDGKKHKSWVGHKIARGLDRKTKLFTLLPFEDYRMKLLYSEEVVKSLKIRLLLFTF